MRGSSRMRIAMLNKTRLEMNRRIWWKFEGEVRKVRMARFFSLRVVEVEKRNAMRLRRLFKKVRSFECF